MNRVWPWLVLALFAGCSQQQPAGQVPDLLKRALATPPSDPSRQLYAYDFEDRIVGGADDERTDSVVRGHVDPSREKGDRVTIAFARDADDAEPEDLKRIKQRYERDGDGLTWCDALASDEVTNVVDKGSSPDGHVFTFTPAPEADAAGQFKDLMNKMLGEAVVDETTATLRSFSATLTKPYNFMLVAEVKTATIKAQCTPLPNGRAFATRMEFQFAGSGFGRAFDVHSVQTISNVTPVE